MKEWDDKVLNQLFDMVGFQNRDQFRHTIAEWSSVIGGLILPAQARVAELGPGVSPKLQFALSDTDFVGTLALVDLDPHVLSAQQFVFSRLRPRFQLITHNQNLFDFSLAGYELVTGNHLIDDLVANHYSKKRGINYEALFSDPIEQVSFWKMVGGDCVLAEEVIDNFANKLSEVQPKARVVLNSYQANFDRHHNITNRQSVCDGLLDRLTVKLAQCGFIQIEPDLGDTNKRWLIMEKTSQIIV